MTSNGITRRQPAARGTQALAWLACASAACLSLTLATPAGAQDPQAAAATAGAPATKSSDPRVGLKPGFKDPGVAAKNVELIAHLPKPEGFFDKSNPAGPATPPERPAPTGPETPEPTTDAGAAAKEAAEKEKAAAAAAAAAPAPAAEAKPAAPGAPARPAVPGAGLSFANSDLVFQGNHLIVGNFNGFNTYSIDNPKKPKLIASTVCPGGQGDVSIHGHLLFMSVEQTRGRLDCGTEGVQAPVSNERFRGVRIFDITDLKKPKQVAAIQTCRGSHTHTLVVDPKDSANVYIYGSGTSTVRSAEELTGCSGETPDKDPNTSLFSIDVIQVPVAAPETAKIVNRPRIFADTKTGNLSGLWQGGDHGPGTQKSRLTNQCHDITVFPEVGLAAGACSGNGILLDISDPVHPTRLDQVTDKNFAYWHSATFNNDGTKVVFTDEWGGGTRPRCRATDLPNWGANAIFNIVDKKMEFAGYYKMPAPQSDQENCVAHNGSLVPVPGRDIMVQAWYQGGMSIYDFTDSAHPVEIAYFDRGPVDATKLITGGYWSTYWYNGHIFGAEIARGLDVFTLKPSEFLSQHEIDAAMAVKTDLFNAQAQPKVVWPATPVVARAYLDQLARSKALTPERIKAANDVLTRVEKVKSAKDKDAGALATELDTLATSLEQDASSATSKPDAARLKSLATTVKGLTTNLRATN
jgi:hypothetical protein